MLSERRAALLANQEKWKEKASNQQRRTSDVNVAKISSLDARKSALFQAFGGWKDRVQHDDSISNLDSFHRLQKEKHALKVSTPKVDQLQDQANGKSTKISPRVSELAKTAIVIKPCAEISKPMEVDEKHEIGPITRRPIMPKNRRLPSNLAALAVDTSCSKNMTASGAMKRSPDSNKENLDDIQPPAKQCLSEDTKRRMSLSKPVQPASGDRTPILGMKNCGIALKRPELKRPYPEVMLIRCKGAKIVDVRCVAPKPSSVHECATFVLVTAKKLIIFEGEFSSLIEKAKAKQIAHSVISTRDLSCLATKFEHSKDDPKVEAEFWKILKGKDPSAGDGYEAERIPDKMQPFLDPENGELFEHAAKQVNHIFEVADELIPLSKGEAPHSSLLNSEKILLFDFGSEIYIWIGHDADRRLVKNGMDFAEKLKNTQVENSKLLFSDDFGENRPNWILVRKLTEGLPDCIFRLKFVDPLPESPVKTPKTPKFSTPRFVMAGKPTPKPAIDLCGLENLLKNEDELIEQLASRLASELPKEHVLELEDTELRPEDENIFTEGIKYFQLIGEILQEQNQLDEFLDTDCYVIKWLYRVERTGIRKLDGTPGHQKDTGRQRTAYFYWFGKNATKKSRGACALALRKFDKDRREHVLMEQGNEIPMFLHLFNGKLIISSTEYEKNEERTYIVHGTNGNYFYAEEIDSGNVHLRPQTAYLILNQTRKELCFWNGKLTKKQFVAGSAILAWHLAEIKGLNLSEKSEIKWKIDEPFEWQCPPKMFRLFDKEGELVQSVQYSKNIFTFKQRDLHGTMMIDQESCLWIWTDLLVSTFHLQVAAKYWKIKNGQTKPAKVVDKGKEPTEFKALFPEWKEFVETELSAEFEAEEPRDLILLVEERTRPRSLEEVRERKLPPGCDTKQLEKYLTDQDFEKIFKMKRAQFYDLPKWKQTNMKKDAKLF